MTDSRQSKDEVRQLIVERRLIGIIRAPARAEAELAAQAALEGGLTLIEFTWNTPGAPQLVRWLAEQTAAATVGAGTITQASEAEQAIDAGARFIVTPVVTESVIEVCRRREVLVVCGASTPTEMWTAHRHGADLVKVFPIATLGGAAYVRLVRGPLPELPLVATGGVTLELCRELLEAGAVAVGATTAVFDPRLMRTGDYQEITRRARAFGRASVLPAPPERP